MDDISHRLETVRAQISTAAHAAGRDPAEIGLVAVSKTQAALSVREAFDAGQVLFGESRAQELVAKAPLLPSLTRWHFIGHLQKNKIRKVLPLVELIHAVDSIDLALDIDRIAAELGLFPRVLLEVNVSGERTKFGFKPEDLREQVERLFALPRVQVEGLMTIAPALERAEEARPFFARLRTLRDEITAETGTRLTTLSMGMSGDFIPAIEEGATLVRVGTAIFGTRAKP
ncbi:MAG TPA: YggS family pyridoxal phosphate-dependent enzyme [Terrimicrobiaceae bacterium]